MCEEIVFSELKVKRTCRIPHLRLHHEEEQTLQKTRHSQKELMKIP